MHIRLTSFFDQVLAFLCLSAFKYGLDFFYRSIVTNTFFSCLHADNVIENEVSGFAKFKYTAAHFLHRIDVYDLKIGSSLTAKIDLIMQNEVYQKYSDSNHRIEYYEGLYRDGMMYCTEYSNEFFILTFTEILPLVAMGVIAGNNLFEIVDA